MKVLFTAFDGENNSSKLLLDKINYKHPENQDGFYPYSNERQDWRPRNTSQNFHGYR